MELDENHVRKSFRQLSFSTITNQNKLGKTTNQSFVSYLRQYLQEESKYSQRIQHLSFENAEMLDTSLGKVLHQFDIYTQHHATESLKYRNAKEEQMIQPLISLTKASDMYVITLEDEIKRANENYQEQLERHRKAKAHAEKAQVELEQIQRKQQVALQEIGIPEFELQRIAAKVQKCTDEVTKSIQDKMTCKQNLLNAIIARDEMASAVSIAYQKNEEERRDQLHTCMKRYIHIEREQLRARMKELDELETQVEGIDRSNDMQIMIEKYCNPENFHFQGKALALLDWQWSLQHGEHSSSLYDEFERRKTSKELVQSMQQDMGSLEAKLEALCRTHFFIPETTSGTGTMTTDTSPTFSTEEYTNLFASLQTNVGQQFDALVKCFDIFLTACVQDRDIKSAKTAMIMAETFYQVVKDDTRQYLQHVVSEHAIWKDPRFWEDALLLAIGEELRKSPQECPWEDLPTLADCQNTNDQCLTREEAVSRIHNIVFGQLGSFTLSMLEFGVPLIQIRHFIEAMCDAHELTEDHRAILHKNLNQIAPT